MICPHCNGRGFVFVLDGDGYGGDVTCEDCNGTGKVEDPHPQHPDEK